MMSVRFQVLAAAVAIFAPNAATRDKGSRGTASRDEELKVLSAVGLRQVMIALTPKFEQETGHKLAVTFGSGAVIARRVQGREAADVVVIPRAAIDDFVRAGTVVASSVVDVARAAVGVAVRRDAPKPDISSPEAFRRTLLAAKSIARPDPALGGSSGLHIEHVLERLGIAEQLRSRTILASHPHSGIVSPPFRFSAVCITSIASRQPQRDFLRSTAM